MSGSESPSWQLYDFLEVDKWLPQAYTLRSKAILQPSTVLSTVPSAVPSALSSAIPATVLSVVPSAVPIDLPSWRSQATATSTLLQRRATAASTFLHRQGTAYSQPLTVACGTGASGFVLWYTQMLVPVSVIVVSAGSGLLIWGSGLLIWYVSKAVNDPAQTSEEPESIPLAVLQTSLSLAWKLTKRKFAHFLRSVNWG